MKLKGNRKFYLIMLVAYAVFLFFSVHRVSHIATP